MEGTLALDDDYDFNPVQASVSYLLVNMEVFSFSEHAAL